MLHWLCLILLVKSILISKVLTVPPKHKNNKWLGFTTRTPRGYLIPDKNIARKCEMIPSSLDVLDKEDKSIAMMWRNIQYRYFISMFPAPVGIRSFRPHSVPFWKVLAESCFRSGHFKVKPLWLGEVYICHVTVMNGFSYTHYGVSHRNPGHYLHPGKTTMSTTNQSAANSGVWPHTETTGKTEFRPVWRFGILESKNGTGNIATILAVQVLPPCLLINPSFKYNKLIRIRTLL